MQENQRTRLSKQLLRNSLLELMKTDTIHKISITQICKKAEVNRSTFYKYYDTEFDLLKDIENEYIAEIKNVFDDITAKNGGITMMGLLRYLSENMEVFKIFFENTQGNGFSHKLVELCLAKMWSDGENLTPQLFEYREYAYQFITYGCINIILQWIENPNRETPEKINKVLMDILGHFFIL